MIIMIIMIYVYKYMYLKLNLVLRLLQWSPIGIILIYLLKLTDTQWMVSDITVGKIIILLHVLKRNNYVG